MHRAAAVAANAPGDAPTPPTAIFSLSQPAAFVPSISPKAEFGDRRHVALRRPGNTYEVADNLNVKGPLINDRQAEHVKAQIEYAVERGAKVMLGGGVNGRFVEPTALTHENRSMDVRRV